jgi:hypothetical protein
MELFNNNSRSTKFSDPSDAYANVKQLYLSIFHLPSQLETNLKAFITTYNENYTSNWNQEMVFGRNDPIATFKDTNRDITIAVDIPAASEQEAKSNLGKCNRVIQYLYPAYQQANRANTISKPPLVRVRFANLIKRANAGDSPSAREGGLLGFITSLTFTPDFDEAGAFDSGTAALFPKKISLNMSFKPLHEHDLGWGDDIGFNDQDNVNFPFGLTDLQAPRTPDDSVNPQATAEEFDDPQSIPDVEDESSVLVLSDEGQDGSLANAGAVTLRAELIARTVALGMPVEDATTAFGEGGGLSDEQVSRISYSMTTMPMGE